MLANDQTVLRKVCEAIEDKKGDDVTILDVSKISTFADFFVICNGHNNKQNQAICDEITTKLKKEARLSPRQIEGYHHADWILIDYLDFVIHIFSVKAREFYRLESLWSDAVEVKPKALSA